MWAFAKHHRWLRGATGCNTRIGRDWIDGASVECGIWDAEVESEVDDALNAVVADSVAADGVRPSVRQALLMITLLSV